MNIQDIAKKLIDHCRSGNWTAAHDELYDSNAVSLEPEDSPNPRTDGIAAIKQKGKEFDKMVEKVHSIEISEPLIADRFISFTTIMVADFVGMGKINMEEICVYEVKGGKITTEQFFYTPEPAN